ncbi:MAG: hypothetical protein J1E41_02520 [Ruminococcus sp.]|nr:hypothetical protein [Ruminococcus sp.]
MKKCDYCGKEISYMEQYCDEDCHRNALKYYELQEKYSKVFSIINIICVFAIPVGLFIFSFRSDIGFTMMSFALAILGLTIMLLPFPVENMISSMKIKKAMKVTRIIGAVLLLLGIILIAVDFIIFLK